MPPTEHTSVPPPDLESLRHLLETSVEPLWETSLLKASWPDEHCADWPALELYRRHFMLFHHLHRMADDYAARAMYLHVHFMRTSLRTLPPPGSCTGFDPEAGRFCGRDLPCPEHPEGLAIQAGGTRAFYLDEANLAWLDGATSEAIVNGGWHLVLAWPKAEAAWRSLGLAPGADLGAVRTRFRHLARTHHPDTRQTEARHPDAGHPSSADGAADARFQEILDAYTLLNEVLSFLPAHDI